MEIPYSQLPSAVLQTIHDRPLSGGHTDYYRVTSEQGSFFRIVQGKNRLDLTATG